jgi:lipid II:glycine glycyltransferase (peptidoglycan interpeptide bridge formation enzyme)
VRSGGPELLDDFYDVVAESWRNLGTPLYRKSYFASILTAFPELTRIFVTYAGAVPVAVAFNGYYRGTVEGMWAGTRAAFRALQPNYVLYWDMIKHACETGCHTYHLGRSTADSAAETFKRKWNSEAHPLYWQYFLPTGGALPALNVNNPKYKLAIAVWRRLPIRVTTLLGPHLANNIP